jgi:hypothetical protein
MDKKILGLIAVVSGLGGTGVAQAEVAPTNAPAPATSFAELLDPVPNAAAVLQAADESRARSDIPREMQAQYHHHHHHHHHWRWWRRHHHHHHHHHHYY